MNSAGACRRPEGGSPVHMERRKPELCSLSRRACVEAGALEMLSRSAADLARGARRLSRVWWPEL
eukprot:14593661-Alexandrium_andersonii.AAC.1